MNIEDVKGKGAVTDTLAKFKTQNNESAKEA